MAKFSLKQGGKEVGSAAVYAEPHTMDGKAMTSVKECVTKPGNGVDQIKMSVGDQVFKSQKDTINPYGVGVMRGYGAATKGRKISGKMG
jgi:hypothetical protein